MASAITIRRQLAPTVGPSAAATGVSFQTGPVTASGERVASGLVLRFGAFDCITDNAACFADATFPEGGSIIHFGDHHVYVAVVPEDYPYEVLTFSDSLFEGGSSCDSSIDSRAYAEIMVIGSCTSDSQGDRARRLARERLATGAGTSSHAPVVDTLELALEGLLTPINLNADPAVAAAELEATHQRILEEALEVAVAQRRFEAMLREYNTAHGFTPANDQPGRLDEVRRRGGDLGEELARDG